MRISDWSSDVCSSDLAQALNLRRRRPSYAGLHDAMADDSLGRSAQAARCFAAVEPLVVAEVARHRVGLAADRQRSEEHTSELQSLMRTSYAVFCLKKKTHNRSIRRITHST